MKRGDNLGMLADPLPGKDPNVGVSLDQGHLYVGDGCLALISVFAAQLAGGARHDAADTAPDLRVREELGKRGAVKRFLGMGFELFQRDFGLLLVDELMFLGFQGL